MAAASADRAAKQAARHTPEAGKKLFVIGFPLKGLAKDAAQYSKPDLKHAHILQKNGQVNQFSVDLIHVLPEEQFPQPG